jgi:hypothetical protein
MCLEKDEEGGRAPICWSMFRPMRLRPMWPMYGTIYSYPSRVSPKQ